MSVVNKMCRDDSGNLLTENIDNLNKKIRLCEDLMKVLNIVYPGRSKYRGLILHELSEAILRKSTVLFDQQKIDKIQFCEDLKIVNKLVEDGAQCLENDRENSMESEVYSNLVKMKETCSDFIIFSNFL